MSERQGTGATNGKDKTSGENGSFIIHPVFAMDYEALQQIMETAF